MKEKIGKAKTWIKEHKKRSAGIAVAIIFILEAAGFGIAGVNNVNANAVADKKVSTETVKKDTSKESVKDTSSTKKDADSDKKEDEQDEVKTEDKDATVSDQETKTDDVNQTANSNAATSTSGLNTNTSSSGSSGLSNEGGNSQNQSHTHSYTIPIYGTDQKWVVDQAAWTETVNEPIYEMVEKCICNGCGADVTADPGSHMKENMMAGNYSCGAWHSEWVQVQTGTNTYTVDHPEQGHWESYSVVTGYRCSCGAIK